MPKKQKSGLYRTSIVIGSKPDGSPIRKYVSGRTMRDLESNRNAVIDYFITGENTADLLFGEYAVDWFRIKRCPRVDPVTAESYRNALNVHILPAFGDRHMRAISSGDVQMWMDQYSGSSASQIDKLYMLIRGIFRAAQADGVVIRDPTAALAKPRPRKATSRRALTPDETSAVLKTIEEHPDGGLLALLYYLGLRRGEALGLQVGDIDAESHMIHVQRDIVYLRGHITVEDLKTDAADRYVVFPARLLPHLTRMSAGKDKSGWLISSRDGNPLSQNGYKRLWVRLMQFAGLVTDKTPTDTTRQKMKTRPDRVEPMDLYDPIITAHYLRHNYVTKLFYAGVDPVLLMWIVGHQTYETTVDTYTHLRKERFRQMPTDMDWVHEIKQELNKLQVPERALSDYRI